MTPLFAAIVASLHLQESVSIDFQVLLQVVLSYSGWLGSDLRKAKTARFQPCGVIDCFCFFDALLRVGFFFFSHGQDKVHIPGAIYLSIKFDSHCNTEEGCDEVTMSSSSDFLHDFHNFSGSPTKWSDFEIPGEETFENKTKQTIVYFFFFLPDLTCFSYIFCSFVII